MTQDLFGFPVELAAPRNFDFILNYGEPFAVWEQQQNGLLCFGLEGARYGRLLIRYAGAPLTAGIPANQAINLLYGAMPAYEALYPHPALIKLQGHGPAAGGYMAIYKWPEGMNLRENDARAQLERQPLLTRLRMIDRVFDFHLFALQKGYQPVGFDESDLFADWVAGRVTIGNIDPYRLAPAVNDQGRMEGSPRFLSPEETTLGAALDDVTAQYALGALACFFLSRYGSGERQDWEAGDGLYQAAVRACQEKREKRFSSLADFVQTWRQEAGKAFRHTIS